MVVLRSPKGLGAPVEVDGHRIEGFWRSHQVPLAEVKTKPEHLRILENWMRSLKPEELFDEYGRVLPKLAEIMPSGRRRMSASPHANAELRKNPALPDFRDYAIEIERPGIVEVENVPPLGHFPARCHEVEYGQLSSVRAR
jgi:xylulose-5-phosphate/fructose-6-phosphate phosphoketolase